MRDNPNIVFILTDQQRYDSLGCYGAEFAHTPNIDRLAAQGAQFKHCYVNNPICTPSRASMLTGLPLPEHGVNRLYDIMGDEHVLVPKYLKDAGYRTALIGKLHISDYKHEAKHRHPNDGFDVYEWCHEPCLALDAEWNGYSRYLAKHNPEFLEELREKGRGIDRFPADCHMSYWAAETTMRFIDETPDDQPFFAMMSLFDPHNPYHDFPEGYDKLLDYSKMPDLLGLESDMPSMPEGIRRENKDSYLGAFEDLDDVVIKAMRVGYHASVAFLDEQVGRVLDFLDERGLTDNTLVVFTSDHGDMLGDHQLLVKGAFFYDPCSRVPMILRWPGVIPAGTQVDALVQPSDLAATFLKLAGVNNCVADSMPNSMDIVQTATGGVGHEQVLCHYLGTGIWKHGGYFDPPIYASMIRDERYKLNLYWDDERCLEAAEGQLFDMINDPDELSDLWENSSLKDVRDRLTSCLKSRLCMPNVARDIHPTNGREATKK